MSFILKIILFLFLSFHSLMAYQTQSNDALIFNEIEALLVEDFREFETSYEKKLSIEKSQSNHRMRARWMDNSSGRFLGVDPYSGDPMSPASLHRYMYANNSPISFSDPSGEFSIGSVYAAINVQSILSVQNLVFHGLRVMHTSVIAKYWIKPATDGLSAVYENFIYYPELIDHVNGWRRLISDGYKLLSYGYEAIKVGETGFNIIKGYKGVYNSYVKDSRTYNGIIDYIENVEAGRAGSMQKMLKGTIDLLNCISQVLMNEKAIPYTDKPISMNWFK